MEIKDICVLPKPILLMIAEYLDDQSLIYLGRCNKRLKMISGAILPETYLTRKYHYKNLGAQKIFILIKNFNILHKEITNTNRSALVTNITSFFNAFLKKNNNPSVELSQLHQATFKGVGDFLRSCWTNIIETPLNKNFAQAEQHREQIDNLNVIFNQLSSLTTNLDPNLIRIKNEAETKSGFAVINTPEIKSTKPYGCHIKYVNEPGHKLTSLFITIEKETYPYLIIQTATELARYAFMPEVKSTQKQNELLADKIFYVFLITFFRSPINIILKPTYPNIETLKLSTKEMISAL